MIMDTPLNDRTEQYNTVQLVVVVCSVAILIVITIALATSVNWLVLASCGIALVLLVSHNIYYFRKLDPHEITQRQTYWAPLAILAAIIGTALFASLWLERLWPKQLGSLWIRLSIFGTLTFGAGIASFTLPLTVQQRFLKLDAKRREYRKLKPKLDSELAIITHEMLVERTPTELAGQLDRIERALRGFFLVSYREVVDAQVKVNYLQYLSPFVGPTVAVILFVIEQLTQ
jgi:hypothetical protein